MPARASVAIALPQDVRSRSIRRAAASASRKRDSVSEEAESAAAAMALRASKCSHSIRR